MRAIVLKEFGDVENFEMTEMKKPKPNAGEILVKVKAVAFNPVDYKIRINGTWAGLKPPIIIGYDVSGIVEEVGEGVKDFKVGDEVYYTPEIYNNPNGAYAEYNVVKANIVSKKPKNLSFIEASAVPLAGGTAWEAIVRRLNIRPYETILIHSGAGGVGSFAVQFAKMISARVIATSSPRNFDFLKQIGADYVIDYNDDVNKIVMEITENKGVDCAFDIQGDNIVSRVLPVIKPFGRVACILPPKGDLSLLYRNNITLYGIFLTRESKRLEEMKEVIERGLVKPIISEVLPFSVESVKKAHKILESGHVRGKIVMEISD
ncbi:MAG: zinc-binding dehydrogenase [candidate division WOR-3 bacterium]